MGGALSGKRIGLLAGWASRQNGGIFEALLVQIALIRDLGAQPIIFAARDRWSQEDLRRLCGAETHCADAVGPRALAYAPALQVRLWAAKLDCLHLHGLWQGSSLTGANWARRHPGRYLISPHGMLDPWITARGRWKKALFRHCVERRNWRAACRFHALSQDEARDIGYWVGDAPVDVIANAAPPLAPPDDTVRAPEIVYLGRIHPKKNIGALIEAWRMARHQLPPQASLTIAGDGNAEAIEALRQHIAPAGAGVNYIGPAYGAQKRALLQRARYLVLPSHSEGLPMAVLDGWAAATPAIMTRACHLPDGFAAGAALRCGTDPASISGALIAALSLDHESWRTMSASARALAGGPYSRHVVAARWEQVYAAVLGIGATNG